MNTKQGMAFDEVAQLLTTNPSARARHRDWYGGVWLRAEHSALSQELLWWVSLGEDRWVLWRDATATLMIDKVWNAAWDEPLSPKKGTT